MNNKLVIGFISLFLVIGLFFINLSNQKNYTSSSSKLTQIKKTDIKKILIQTNIDAIELIKIDTTWEISGNDTLKVKDQSIDSFFDQILNLDLQNTMTSKKEKWNTYNIDDSTGTHLAIVDFNDNTIGYFVFGKSNSDYSRCYVRTDKSDNVYLANKNVMYNLQTRATYWGDKPKEIVPSEEL